MTIAETLTITPVATETKDRYCFDCAGSIDAHADPVLNALRGLPAGARVALDFARVERVNSMGLSLLLQLFEEWENRGTRPEVYNLNRMIGMLFKITGLGRFLECGVAAAGALVASGGGAAHSVLPARDPPAPFHTHSPSPRSETSKTAAGAKLNFVASLQTGQQLSGWYLLNTYLQRRLQRAIHFEQSQIALEPRETPPDIIFTKPFDACEIMRSRGFVPIMCPTDEADEVVILMRAGDARSLVDLDGARVVTASPSSFVYLLGRFLCDENGLSSQYFEFTFGKNEIKSLQLLLQQQADVLFMLKKTYDGLSSLSRNATRVIDESSTQFAFHLFCIAPHLNEIKDSLVDVLGDMGEDEQGRRILKDIQIEGWRQPEAGELRMLRVLFERYAQ